MVFAVCLGVCTDASGTHHWAHIHQWVTSEDKTEVVRGDVACGSHICTRDHVSTWDRAARIHDVQCVTVMGFPKQLTVDLTFTACPVNETGKTLVMHVGVNHPKCSQCKVEKRFCPCWINSDLFTLPNLPVNRTTRGNRSVFSPSPHLRADNSSHSPPVANYPALGPYSLRAPRPHR